MRLHLFGLLPLLLLFSVFLSAQPGSISGKIIESPKKPVSLATIAIYSASDTLLLTYRLSTPDGRFKVPGLPLNVRLRILITHTGFDAFRKEFELSSSGPAITLDSILLTRTSKQLDEVVVYAELPPVVIKKDTLEFNASAFKTLPNAMVEDLLKKLPGVDVERDGTISVEGKIVNRILVDGKTFFGDDPKMASRNLPASVIDKVQVIDDKEEMMRRGDDNPNNVGKVINLTFKKGVKKGWFGRVYAGKGSEKLYNAGGIGNIYRDTLQLSILAYANNINKAPFSFSELLSAGGFQRSRSNSANTRTNVWRFGGLGTGISIDNVNFGGAQGLGGIQASKGVGFNLNHAPTNRRSFFLQYFYNRGDCRERLLTSNADQFKNDTVINTNTRQTGPYFGNRHNLAAGLRLKPDSVTNILFNVSAMDAGGVDDRNIIIKTTNNFTGILNNGIIDQKNDNRIYTYRHNLSITRLSKLKKGRRFTFGHDLDHRRTKTDDFSNSQNHFYFPVVFDTAILQLRKENVPTTEGDVYFNYSEPVNGKITLRLAARFDFSRYNNEIQTFNYNPVTQLYDKFNAFLTNTLHRKNNQFSSNAVLEYRWKELTISPGLKLLGQKIINSISNLPMPIQQNTTNLLPTFSLIYKTWNLYYDRNVILPAYNYLIAIPDNSNPYYINLGNPGLLAAVKNQVSLSYRKNILKKLLTYGFNSLLGFTRNDVVPFITVDPTGVFTNTPVNQNGSRNAFLNFYLNKQYKQTTKFNLSLNFSASFSNVRNKLLYNYVSSWQNNRSVGGRTGFYINLDNKFEWTLNYAINKQMIRYSTGAFTSQNLVYQNFENELILRLPKHFIWEINILYNIQPDVTPFSTVNPFIWNSAVNYTFLKKEQGVLKFEVSDLLNGYRHTNTISQGNAIITNTNNSLSRYFLLSFTYNIQTIGNKKNVGGWRSSLF